MHLHFIQQILSYSVARAAVAIAILAALPIFCIVLFTDFARSDDLVAQATKQASITVSGIAKAQTSITANTKSLLAAIAKVAPSHTPFNVHLSKLSSIYSGHSEYFLVNSNNTIINTASRYTTGGLPSEAQKESPINKMHTGDTVQYVPHSPDEQFLIGTSTFSQQDNSIAIHYGYKIIGTDTVLGVRITPENYSYLYSKLSLPTDAQLYITDSAGHAVFASPPLPANTLYTLPPEIFDKMKYTPNEPVSFVIEHNGSQQFVVYESLTLPGNQMPYAYVVLNLPQHILEKTAQGVLQTELTLLAIAFICTLFLCASFAYVTLAPQLYRLLQAAKHIANGQPLPSSPPYLFTAEFIALYGYLLELAEYISLRKQALLHAQTMANIAAKTKQQFLTNMGHEIRTPMNAIIGMAYLTLKEELTIQQRKYLNNIHTSGQELLQGINDILELAQLDMDKTGMEKQYFSITELFLEVRQRFSGIAHNKNISLSLSVAENVPQATEGDSVRLGQVIAHLVDNAIRYSTEGPIEVACEVEYIKDNVAHLAIHIKDHGKGIRQDKLLQLQSLLNDTTTGEYEPDFDDRHCLGLLLTQRIMQLMGGRVSVVSEPAVGSTFTIHVPLRATFSKASQFVKTLRNLRVLIVDDDEILLTLLASLLRSFGMRVDTTLSAENVKQHIQWADSDNDPYAFVFIDWKMPTYDGMDLCAEIKNSLLLKSSPFIIIISAFGFSLSEAARQRAEVDAFLHKPINQSVLFDTLMTLLQPQNTQLVLIQQFSQAQQGIKQLQGLSILLAEDNPVNQQIVAELLADANVTLHIANNGLEALEHFIALPEKAPFDIVLMDMQMPKLNGFEVSTRIRKLPVPWALDIPIIALTAHTKQSSPINFAASGLNDYIGKPIAVDDLYATIQRWLPVVPITDANVRKCLQDLYVLCENQKLLPALALFHNISGLLEIYLHEGRVKYLQELINAGNFTSVTKLLKRLNHEAKIMQEGDL